MRARVDCKSNARSSWASIFAIFELELGRGTGSAGFAEWKSIRICLWRIQWDNYPFSLRIRW